MSDEPPANRKPSKKRPTARTLERLRNEGHTAPVVERWVKIPKHPGGGVRQDLFGGIVMLKSEQVQYSHCDAKELREMRKAILGLPKQIEILHKGMRSEMQSKLNAQRVSFESPEGVGCGATMRRKVKGRWVCGIPKRSIARSIRRDSHECHGGIISFREDHKGSQPETFAKGDERFTGGNLPGRQTIPPRAMVLSGGRGLVYSGGAQWK